MRGALAVTCVLPLAAGAQSPGDSLLARLRRAEAAIQTLQQQVAEQSEGGTHTRSGAKLTISGRVAVHAFGNVRRVNNVDNPQFVLEDAAGIRGGGMAIRQSRFRFALSGLPRTLGGDAMADVDVDFYGGQMPSSGGRTFPLLRIRTARGFITWKQAELMVGQESPLISGVNPESPAAIGTPLFATAGNLWLWLPQVRVTAYGSQAKRAGVQLAVLAPTSGDPAGAFDTDADVAERSMRPYLQGRAFVRFGGVDPEEASEMGCGAHQGWLRTTQTELVSTSAIACDALVRLGGMMDARAELFTGQALRGLGGGGIGQNLTGALEPARTTGGWLQLNARPAEWLRFGAGAGADHPEPGVARRRNDALAVHASVRPAGAFFVGWEFRRLRTEWAANPIRMTNDHVTVSLGFEF